MVEMLPEIEVVADDAFNSDPADPKNMGPDARQRHAAGESLPTTHVPTPLVRIRFRLSRHTDSYEYDD